MALFLVNYTLDLLSDQKKIEQPTMAKIDVYLPAMGEGVIEATITRMLKKEGDRIEEDEAILEVATDKVDSEVPSPASGIIAKLFYKEGEAPKVGSVIAIIVGEGETLSEAESKTIQEDKPAEIFTFAVKDPLEIDSSENPNAFGSTTPKGKFLSPLVRKIAVTEGISMAEIDLINGSGQDGRITKNDLLSYLSDRGKSEIGILVDHKPSDPVPAGQSLVKAAPVLPAASKPIPVGAEDEIIEMDRMRKLIAEHMVYSVQTSPHVTSFVEIDVTNLVEWRNKTKDAFLRREGEKLTFTPAFIEASAKALRDFPMVNVSVNGTQIIKRKKINVGMATALPSGNLIVPVIKNADQLNMVGLAKSVNDLANRARNNKLNPDEISGGTFTITNFGSFDNLSGTPIINQPEVAILGVGAIKKKPWVVETPQGDFIAIRHIMMLSLSYDHRVVDGALGGQFLRRVGDYLENWDVNRMA